MNNVPMAIYVPTFLDDEELTEDDASDTLDLGIEIDLFTSDSEIPHVKTRDDKGETLLQK